QRGEIESFERAVMTDGFERVFVALIRLSEPGDLAVPFDRIPPRSHFGLRRAAYDGEVDAFRLASHKLLSQFLLGLERFGEEDQPRRIAINAVDYERLPLLGVQVFLDHVEERSFPKPMRMRSREQAGGFVGDQDVAVFVDDV